MKEGTAVQLEMQPAHVDVGTLLQDQKTELVGQMAGVMANQFNNIMMAITSYAEVELKRASPAQQRGLEQILHGSARAASLIQRLLAFTQKHAPSPCKLALNPAVQDICSLLQALVGDRISVVVNLGAQVGSIVADSFEIEQVVLSLGLNAQETIAPGGSLHISTALLDHGPGLVDRDFVKPGEPYAMLCLRFTPEDSTPRRDSFRAGDHDVSMRRALVAARRIIEERRGQFRASTRPSEGTTFRIYFPVVADAAADAEKTSTANAVPSTKTILIVEDDDSVRNPTAEFLKMEGFKVLQARNGAEALRVVQESRSKLDLLVTDIMMAGMDGNKVAEELSKTHPGLRVLFMSGDTKQAARKKKNGVNPVQMMLQKPFRLNALSAMIRRLLGE